MIKKERLKRINREWLEENGFSPLEEVRKRIEGDNYPIKRKNNYSSIAESSPILDLIHLPYYPFKTAMGVSLTIGLTKSDSSCST